MMKPSDFSRKSASRSLEHHLSENDLLKDAQITAYQELDILDYYGFAAFTSTRQAGLVYFLVNEQRILTGSNEKDFDLLARQLLNQKQGDLSAEEFIPVFLKMRVARTGEIIKPPFEHPLLDKTKYPSGKFSKPDFRKLDNGDGEYSFWLFNTQNHKPEFFIVQINKKGKVDYSIKDFPH